MPVFNFTIDDVSPTVIYSGAWSDSSHTDASWPKYFDGTFHATQELDDTAMFSFHGSAIYLFGAFRINHNIYTVTLDGQSTSADGLETGPPEFQQNMFNTNGLDLSKQHQIMLQNTFQSSAAPFVDLDFIIITDGDGNSSTQSVDTTLDDDDTSIQYSSGWNTMQQTGYFQSSMHRTDEKGNSATVTFRGNAIAVYGGTAPDHGLFSVSIDGGSPQTYNGSAPVQRTQVLLYYASGISDAQHKITITNVDDNNSWLDLDKVVVSDWSGSGDSSPPTSPQGTGTPDTPSPTPSGPQNSASGNGASTNSHTSVAGGSTSSGSSSLTSTASTSLPSTAEQSSHTGGTGEASTFVAPAPLSSPTDSSTSSGSAFGNTASGLSTMGGSNDTSTSASTIGPIVGGVIGGVAILAIVFGILLYYVRHRHPSYPSRLVPSTLKTSSWEEYREHYRGGTPAEMHQIPHVEPESLPATLPRRFPPSPSNAATGGYDTTILQELALPSTPNRYPSYSPRSASLAYTDMSRLQSPPPTYSQAGDHPSMPMYEYPEPDV